MKFAPAIIESTDPAGRPRRLVLRLNSDGMVPFHEQLRAQLSVMVAVGHVLPGSRLPTIRNMAKDLNLAPGTVARAYREMEADGAVVGRGRQGTFVVDEPPHSEPLRQRRERLELAADHFAFEAQQLGLGREDTHHLLTEALIRLADPEQFD
ncbi:MAG: GntR family transcriptional regulator [Acidimicrobiales bacterium]|nr:GntR family transcriptional regulator [Acidimicrobiales bacterium]